MTGNGGAIQTICAVYDGLTPTDQRIANYILEHRARIPDMTMREIAKECQTSSPTVSRFIKRIGYESFAQMRLELARTESLFSRDFLLGSTTGSISFDRFNESLRFILSCKTAELTDTAAQIDPATIKAVIDLLLELRHLGIRAIAPSTTEYAASYSFMMTERDVLVIISSSGISKRLGKIFDNAEDNGTPVVLITSNPQSTFVKRSKHVIMAYQRDRLFAYGVPFSHNSVNFVIEVLFLFLHASSVDAAEHIKLFSHTYDDLDKIIDFRSGEFIDLED